MSHEGDPPAKSETSSYQDQFKVLTEELTGVMQRHPSYFQDQRDYFTKVLAGLDRAKQRLEAGEIAVGEPLNITVFGGLQSRNIAYAEEHEKNRVVEDLYVSLNRLAGYAPSNYHDLERDIEDLAGKGMVIPENDKTYLGSHYWVKGDRIAVGVDREHPSGLRLKLSDNILASFVLGNYGRPETIGQMTFVNLAIVHG